MTSVQSVTKKCLLVWALISVFSSGAAFAQEVRYSYLQMAFTTQGDVDRMGLQTTAPGQSVEYDAQDGAGIKFRGSVGTWNNLYAFIDYTSTDPDVQATITSPDVMNPGGPAIVSQVVDEFDVTTIRGGLGLKYSLGLRTDLFVEATYDSNDFDFGSFALENFDVGDKDFGAALGVRHMFTDDLEVRGWGRYSGVGDMNIQTFEIKEDTLFGAGFGWELIRGFSLVGDFEFGELTTLSFGFRLDLDEN